MPFVKGQSGNPKGRPKGSKDRFREDFWRDLAKAWEAQGISVIENVIAKDPGRFLQVAAGLLPKEEEHKHSMRTFREATECLYPELYPLRLFCGVRGDSND